MTWPVVTIAEVMAELTRPGAPFEMAPFAVQGRRLRAYVNARPNLRVLLDESRRFANRDFLVYEGERVSFEAHWRAAHAFARVLTERFHVAKGDRVAVAMRNYPEWSVCAWGALAVGAVLVPLNAWESGPGLARMLAHCGAKVVVADAERVQRLSKQEVAAAQISVRAEAAGATPLVELIGELADYASLPDQTAPDPGLQPDDLATIFYTSGTTGAPKGAVGTHRNVLTNLVNLGFRAARAALRRGDPLPAPAASQPQSAQLLPLPLFHVTGFHSTLVAALANGTKLVLMYKWDVDQALDLVARERIGVLTLVPALAWELIRAAPDSGRDLSSVTSVSYGGAAAAPELAGQSRAVFPTAMPGQGYGATETSSVVASINDEDFLRRPGSVGVGVPCCDFRVVDGEGRDVARGEPGELWVSGPNVVMGYWNQPEATEAGFVEGWYRTGDIVRMDDEGFIFVLDRLKDMLIRGGENIYCVEIEDVLATYPGVAEAAVLGVPDKVMGELVGAVVRLNPGVSVTAEALRAHVAGRTAPHKAPVVLQFTDRPLPRNAAGKVVKRELRDIFQGFG
jgi:long-chain acyl-CoA synthetase